jgi:3-oxoacyl-[acyl-carrier protein] reductase
MNIPIHESLGERGAQFASDDKYLRGRVMIVTGGGKNLGRVLALEAAHLGASLVIVGLNDSDAVDSVVHEIKNQGGSAIGFVGDITDEEFVRNLVREAREALGTISIVAHCAAFRSAHLPLASIPIETWNRAVSVALDAAFLLVRETIDDMINSKFGRIILIGGPSSYLGLPHGSTHGASSKAGMIGFARAIAQEFGAFGVTANVVTPGTLDTERNKDLKFSGWDPLTASALGRKVSLQEVSTVCLSICSDGFAAVNGSNVLVDGAMTSLGARLSVD